MRRQGFALVELLVVIAIVAVLVVAYMGFRSKRDKAGPETIPGKAIQKAESVECQSNLSQIRQMVQMEVMDSEQYPARIDQGATASISKCPVSGKPYSYNPQTGQVWCTTPGHEKY
ncbi:MAG: prepilin-type N-terminal cleavage/methylation domain-containing protein [Armatimonadetes bacterium]|nr:prepilin-type N-terminal cleavage/methylation domain-containing protein [Armatimonadota bacterium]